MRTSLYLHILFLFLFASSLTAQDNFLKDYAPVAPTPASLGKYGDIPVSYHTGLPDISIPIYTLAEGAISVPVNMSYHASGIRVQETASWVGLGWALNAGGVITRTVQGAPDEGGNVSQTNGYYKDGGNGMDPGECISPQVVESGNYDMEPDIFNFNITGYAGKFFFDKNKKIHIVPQQDLLINEIAGLDGSGVFRLFGWIITDPQGVRYHFGATDGSMNMNDYVEKTVSTNDPAAPERPSSWYMSKIESADRKDLIQFTYTEEKYAFWNISTAPVAGAISNCAGGSIGDAYKTRVIGKRLTAISGVNSSISFTGDTNPREDLSGYTYCTSGCSTHLNSEAKALKTIQIKGKDASCLRQFDFSYTYSALASVGPLATNQLPPDGSDRKRLVLNSLTESACGSTTNNKVHSFEYYDINVLPRRASASQDHWGYHNGMNNTDLAPGFPYGKTGCNACGYNANLCSAAPTKREPAFPAMRNGTLKKVTYPTGGSSTFDFEAHTVWGADTICSEANISQVGLTAGSCTGWNQGDYSVSFTQNQINLGIKLELKWQPYNTSCTYNGNATIEIKTCSTCSPIWSASTNGTSYYSLSGLALIAGQNYIIRLTNNGGISNFRFYNLNKSTTQSNKTIGGLRIKTITTTDGDATTSNNNVKNFNYHTPAQPVSSSGRLIYMPIYAAPFLQSWTSPPNPPPYCIYYDNSYPYTGCPPVGIIANAVFAPTGLQPMQTTMGSHIGYTRVTVSETGNGKSIYSYNAGIYENGPWKPTGYPFPPPPYEPLVGTMAREEHFNNSDVKVLEKIFTYISDTSIVVSGFEAMKFFHVNSGHTSDAIRAYSLNTGYTLLSSIRARQYNPDGITYVDKVTDIGYSPSNGHLQKTTEDVTDSDNTVYRTKYKYAKDYPCPSSTPCDETNGTANLEGKAIYAMRKRNMVAIPIEQTTWLKRLAWGPTFKLTGATYFQFDKVNTSYDNLKLKAIYQVRPASASTSFTESTTSTSGTFTKNGAYIQEYNFVFSDTHGKILSQWKQNDPAKQQYIWGYNQKIPTAKVINAETTEIAYTSFEEQLNTPAGNGNWTLTGVGGGWSNTSGEFQTGRTGYNLTPAPRACTASGVPAGKYVVSFWHKNGSVFVNGASVSTASSTWKYGETVLTFTNSSNTVTVSSGSGDWGQFIDELRLYPSDALMRSFSYNDRSQLLLSLADENSVPAHYDYDNFQRLQAVRDQDRNIVQTYEYNYQQAGAALNDIKARTVLTSGQTTVSAVNALTGPDVRRVFQYMDGLGRPVQTNAIGQSPTAKDIISINQYDQYGREPKQYIPYTNTTNSGAYRSAALTEQAAFGTTYGAGTIAFAQSVFEPSPLNRVTEQGAPGTTWQTGQGVNAHTIRSAWKGNLASEDVRDFTNGNSFGNNKLWRTETKDENGRFQYTYTDNLGRTVMVRQQLPLNLAGQEDTTYARTYTVYDDFGRVVAVIPPEAAKKMKAAINWDYTSATYSSMVYLYTYDSRGRLISKSVPSGGTTTIAYDRLDRPVLSTNANGFKIFTRYDILSRPIVSGRYKGSGSPGGSDPLFETPTATAPHFYTTAAFPTDNNLDVYKVLYYDDYDIDNNGSLGATETYTNPAEAGYETAAFLRTRGKPTAAKTAILKNDNSAPTTYLTTRTYFDKEYSVIQVNKQNHLGGSDISSSVYDFANRITKTRRDHTATPPGGTLKTYTIREEYIYDEAGRVRFTRHNALTGTGTPPAGSWVVTSAPIYDELNRMIDKRLHASNYDGTSTVSLNSAFNYLQSVDYSYNIRGWLTGMNDVTTCTTQSGDNLGDMFKMSLTYESTATGGTAQYNGNISTMQWSTSVNTTTCSNRSLYRFSYDGANRLTAARYLIWTGGWNTVNYYTESGIKYDMNGNLKSYTRQGLMSSAPNTFGLIDQLTYTYGDALRPDRLTQMADAGSITKGFKPGSGLTGDHYLYDANGNMTQDKHKNFVISYNHLNLPNNFAKGANFIIMTYTADGEKLTKAFTFGGTTKNYVGGIEYSASNLEAIYHGEGRLTPNGSNFFYEYTLKDHLSNARINFRANGAAVTFLEEQHYYPFGMRMEGIGATAVTDNPYEYNGKEFNDDFSLGLSDYGARWYDGAIGRWLSPDPLAAKFPNWSLYNFVENNPIRLVDPTGMAPDDYVYLNTKGEEIGRIKDDKVKQVTIIKDENLQKFDDLPYGRESIDEAAAMGASYDTKSIDNLYKKSAKDILSKDSPLKPYDGNTGEPKNNIANEHGAILELKNGVATVGEENTAKSPISTTVNRNLNDNEVAVVHTHPNEGKGLTRFSNGTSAEFTAPGPSMWDKNHSPSTKGGFLNVVVDKNNIYFYNQSTTISIPRSKL